MPLKFLYLDDHLNRAPRRRIASLHLWVQRCNGYSDKFAPIMTTNHGGVASATRNDYRSGLAAIISVETVTKFELTVAA
jgi:hypothetical protein